MSMRGRPTLDLTGQTFGELRANYITGRTKHRNTIWHCTCLACGRASEVTSGDLRSGHTTSCGCTKAARIAKARTKHGAKPRGAPPMPEYVVWCAIIQRCTNKKNPAYKYYGGRGITVCARWRASFKLFLKDMGFRPTDQHSIERKKNHLGYTKNNCIWATRDVQANNKRNNRLLTYKNETATLAEWARRKGMKARALGMRLNVYGFTLEEALETPVGVRR